MPELRPAIMMRRPAAATRWASLPKRALYRWATFPPTPNPTRKRKTSRRRPFDLLDDDVFLERLLMATVDQMGATLLGLTSTASSRRGSAASP